MSIQNWLLHSNSRADDDTVLLDFNSAIRIRRSDLWRVAEHDGWLNDIIVNFCFERHRVLAKSQGRDVEGELIDANVAHFMQYGQTEDVAQLVADLKLDSSKLICFPVNDETDLSLHQGGCHWSLLVHTPAVTADVSARWSHVDSMNHRNIKHAEQMARQVATAFLINEGKGQLAESLDVNLFSLEDTPQQKNGYDCGVFVVELARRIVDFGVDWEISDDFQMLNVDASLTRKALYDDLEYLMIDESL